MYGVVKEHGARDGKDDTNHTLNNALRMVSTDSSKRSGLIELL